MLAEMAPWMTNVIFFPVNRWIHLVASTLLVGGVFFFEFVVPIATADLKEEQQLAVFGRARWVFRTIVRTSMIAFVITGGVSMWHMWSFYAADEQQAGHFLWGPRPWVFAHVGLALLAFALMLRVIRTRVVMSAPVAWMRATLVVLLICMFLANVARQVQLRLLEWRDDSDPPQRLPM